MKKNPTITPEPLLNGKLLKNNSYSALKKYAIELKINLKSLKKLNENNLIKAIKVVLADQVADAPTPFDKLEGQSVTFKINYAHHLGVPKQEIVETLGITVKRYVDVVWLYDNKGYKEKVLAYLQSQKQAA